MTLIIFIGFFLIGATGALAYGAGARVERRSAGRTRAIDQASSFSMFCPCGDEWGKWQNIETERRPLDPRYPLTGGTIENHVQMRHCTSCNRADRRVL